MVTTDDDLYDDEEMTIGVDCCPHYVPYGSDCDECDEEDADMAMGMTPNAKVVRPAACGRSEPTPG